jgi:hypothetical protein
LTVPTYGEISKICGRIGHLDWASRLLIRAPNEDVLGMFASRDEETLRWTPSDELILTINDSMASYLRPSVWNRRYGHITGIKIVGKTKNSSQGLRFQVTIDEVPYETGRRISIDVVSRKVTVLDVPVTRKIDMKKAKAARAEAAEVLRAAAALSRLLPAPQGHDNWQEAQNIYDSTKAAKLLVAREIGALASSMNESRGTYTEASLPGIIKRCAPHIYKHVDVFV